MSVMINQSQSKKNTDTWLNIFKNNAKLYLTYKRTIETYLKYKIFLIDIESGISIYISFGLILVWTSLADFIPKFQVIGGTDSQTAAKQSNKPARPKTVAHPLFVEVISNNCEFLVFTFEQIWTILTYETQKLQLDVLGVKCAKTQHLAHWRVFGSIRHLVRGYEQPLVLCHDERYLENKINVIYFRNDNNGSTITVRRVKSI